jgi:hypothetical protein
LDGFFTLNGLEGRTTKMRPTSDNGFVIAGSVKQNREKRGSDFGVIKLDSNRNVEWQRMFGGSNDDDPSDILQTTDGGFIVVGKSASVDGDVKGNDTHSDAWAVKINNKGLLEWQKCLGIFINKPFRDDYNSSYQNEIRCVEKSYDDGYIMTGFSYVSSVSKEKGTDGTPNFNNHTNLWVLKVSSMGEVRWSKTLTGLNDVSVNCIQNTSDSGFILGGSILKISEKSNRDALLMKFSESGTVEWKMQLGGSEDEHFNCIQETVDKGYIAAGYTDSKDGLVIGHHEGQKTENYHGFDLKRDGWIVKISSRNKIEWQKCLGGSGEDEMFYVHEIEKNKFLVAGRSMSRDGNLKLTNELSPIGWFLKLGDNGQIIWQKTISAAGYGSLIILNQERSYIIGSSFLRNENSLCTWGLFRVEK